MKISVCIACHNQAHLLGEALVSCLKQDYKDLEVIVLDDASTDNPRSAILPFPEVKMYRSETPSGTGGAFNKAMEKATSEYIVLLCADDVFTDPHVLSDIAKIFINNPKVAHVSRYYHQFIDGDRRPVRAWRTNDIMELANNPSGLAFRKSALSTFEPIELGIAPTMERLINPPVRDCLIKLSNKMFVEASSLVASVMRNKENYAMIMPWDTVAVRIHQSIARNPSYYRKMWKSSPVKEWSKVGGGALQSDFTSLVQIKNYFTTWAVIQECWNFILLRPINILIPGFWFYALICIFTPRCILMRLPDLYRRTWGRWTTREVKRP